MRGSRKGHNIDLEFQRDQEIENYDLVLLKYNTTYERDQFLPKDTKNRTERNMDNLGNEK